MSLGAEPGRTRIFYVGIFCDSCGRQETGDVTASSQGAAEDGLRVDLATVKGWVCDAAGDFCPRCGLAAAVAATEPAEVEVPPNGAVVATAGGTVVSTGRGGGAVAGPVEDGAPAVRAPDEVGPGNPELWR